MSVWGLAAGAVLVAGAAAALGAWGYGQYLMGQLPSAGVVYQPSSRAMADAGMLRASLNQLASKVGELQARLIEMDSVSQRVAQVAGISYTDPEVQASLEEGPSVVMDEPAGMAVPYESAEALGRRLDDLDRRLARQRDSFALLDLVMTRRAGTEAGLPSVAPVNYPFLSSSYGWRRHPISGRMAMHEGLDFAAPYGAPIHAASGGVVVYAGYKPGYGKTVEIQHGSNLLTRYAHASKLQVKTGDLVEKGQLVANVGTTGRSTGPHLHFEVRIADQPLNPSLFLPADTDSDQTLVASALGDEGATDPEVR